MHNIYFSVIRQYSAHQTVIRQRKDPTMKRQGAVVIRRRLNPLDFEWHLFENRKKY